MAAAPQGAEGKPMSNDPKPYTYAELLEDLKQLTPEQLAYPVRWMGNERGGKIARLDITEEDFVNMDGDFAEPISTYLSGSGALTYAGEESGLTPEQIRAKRVAFVGQPFLEEV